jgi:hypothetical protein
MEGRERAFKAFYKTPLSIFSCCKKEKKKFGKFMDKYQLKVRKASDPKHIIWKNLGAGWCKRCMGALIRLIVLLILVCAIAAGLWYYQREMVTPFEKKYPPYDLYTYKNFTVTEEMAINDYYNETIKYTNDYETRERFGFMRVFCENNQGIGLLSDGIDHCSII